jgi:hypothetical protein
MKLQEAHSHYFWSKFIFNLKNAYWNYKSKLFLYIYFVGNELLDACSRYFLKQIYINLETSNNIKNKIWSVENHIWKHIDLPGNTVNPIKFFFFETGKKPFALYW